MRNKVSVVLVGIYVLLVVLSVAAIFLSDDSLSGVFLVLLGSPWTQLLTKVIESIGGGLNGNVALGLAAGLTGCVINAAIIFFVSRWILAKLTTGKKVPEKTAH